MQLAKWVHGISRIINEGWGSSLRGGGGGAGGRGGLVTGCPLVEPPVWTCTHHIEFNTREKVYSQKSNDEQRMLNLAPMQNY